MSKLIVECRRLMSDHLTPVLAYRRLVAPDSREAPSFLFESVEQGGAIGRYSMLGSRPSIEVVVKGGSAEILNHAAGTRRTVACEDGLALLREVTPAGIPDRSGGPLPGTFWGGWVGYTGFDSVRWLQPGKLPFSGAPRDDRDLPDLHMGLYRCVMVFDHVDKTLSVVAAEHASEHASEGAARAHARAQIEQAIGLIQHDSVGLGPGAVDMDTSARGHKPRCPTFTEEEFLRGVRKVKEYISAGDAFQVVLSQRFERHTASDPFDLYRALRVVNPSPYQIYLQARGAMLIAASPEILCRVKDRVVFNRPLAGTRPRGSSPETDQALEQELLADAKERAEHVMLVDLGRNDLGLVCEKGSVKIDRCMEVERYSHVMHISSTLSGRLRAGQDCFDALRATLPVGTVSGAPKVRALQIIDEIEPVRRGPYAGGIGAIGWNGDMDIALALRTMVVPTSERKDGMWRIDIQAGAGIVLDSDPKAEFEETVSKAAALSRAIDLAESGFSASSHKAHGHPAPDSQPN